MDNDKSKLGMIKNRSRKVIINQIIVLGLMNRKLTNAKASFVYHVGHILKEGIIAVKYHSYVEVKIIAVKKGRRIT